jgi:hypothetical protein
MWHLNWSDIVKWPFLANSKIMCEKLQIAGTINTEMWDEVRLVLFLYLTFVKIVMKAVTLTPENPQTLQLRASVHEEERSPTCSKISEQILKSFSLTNGRLRTCTSEHGNGP